MGGFYSKQLLENAAAGKQKLKWSLAELKEVETVVSQMMAAGFGSEHVTACCRAIFVDLSDANLDDAFKCFDGGDGFARKEDLKKALPLMRKKDVAQDRIDKLFASIETTDNGHISSQEFKMLIKAVRGQEDLAFRIWQETRSWGLPKTADKAEPETEATESKEA